MSAPQSDHPEVLAPHSVEAEEAFLGAVLFRPEIMPDFCTLVKPDDFFIIRNGWVWGAMLALYARHDEMDYLTLVQEVKAQGHLDEIGGAAYITWLLNQTPTSMHAATYAAFILRASYRRKVTLAASYMANLSHDAALDTATIQARIDAVMVRLRNALPATEEYLAGETAHEVYTELIATRLDTVAPKTIDMPYAGFDQDVPSIKEGKLILVSGFTGRGKTIFLEQWAEWLAIQKHRVLYIPTELTIEDHLDRRYCRYSGIPYARIVKPCPEMEAQIAALQAELSWSAYLDIWEYNGGGIDAVLAQMKRAYEHGRRVFIVDYFWEVLADDQRTTIDRAAKELHAFAKSAQTRSWVIVASQLTETEYGPRTYGTRRLDQKAALHLQILPTEKDETGTVFSVGDRLVKTEPGKPSPVTTVQIVKNTFGPTGGEVELFLDGERFRFIDSAQVTRTTIKLNEDRPVKSETEPSTVRQYKDDDGDVPF